jgi:hypothetical protein
VQLAACAVTSPPSGHASMAALATLLLTVQHRAQHSWLNQVLKPSGLPKNVNVSFLGSQKSHALRREMVEALQPEVGGCSVLEHPERRRPGIPMDMCCHWAAAATPAVHEAHTCRDRPLVCQTRQVLSSLCQHNAGVHDIKGDQCRELPDH